MEPPQGTNVIVGEYHQKPWRRRVAGGGGVRVATRFDQPGHLPVTNRSLIQLPDRAARHWRSLLISTGPHTRYLVVPIALDAAAPPEFMGQLTLFKITRGRSAPGDVVKAIEPVEVGAPFRWSGEIGGERQGGLVERILIEHETLYPRDELETAGVTEVDATFAEALTAIHRLTVSVPTL